MISLLATLLAPVIIVAFLVVGVLELIGWWRDRNAPPRPPIRWRDE